jgi:hypothetical protein
MDVFFQWTAVTIVQAITLFWWRVWLKWWWMVGLEVYRDNKKLAVVTNWIHRLLVAYGFFCRHCNQRMSLGNICGVRWLFFIVLSFSGGMGFGWGIVGSRRNIVELHCHEFGVLLILFWPR